MRHTPYVWLLEEVAADAFAGTPRTVGVALSEDDARAWKNAAADSMISRSILSVPLWTPDKELV